MLEHIGRKSGQRRYVVLEVIDHGPGWYVVAAGFGRKADWLRNVEAQPRVRVWIGARAEVPATAHRVAGHEAASVLARYATEHPRAWARLAPVLDNTLGERANSASLPVVRLELDR